MGTSHGGPRRSAGEGFLGFCWPSCLGKCAFGTIRCLQGEYRYKTNKQKPVSMYLFFPKCV